MILIIDNGSRAIENIIKFLEVRNKKYVVNDFKKIDAAGYSGVIITGTQIGPEETETYMGEIEFMKTCKKPLLAICGAHLLLTLSYGGEIKKGNPVMGKQPVRILKQDKLVLTLPETFFVFQKHNREISRLPGKFSCVAKSDTCRYEIIRHNEKPVYGVQFHPERRNDGSVILDNFLRIVENEETRN